MNAFIDRLYAPLGTTSNYSDTAKFYNSQITTPPAKPFPACSVFTSRSLAAASNSEESSASRVQVLFSQPPMENSQFPQSQVRTIIFGTLNPALCCNSQLPCYHLFSVCFGCKFSPDSVVIHSAGPGSSLHSFGADPTILPLLGVVAETCLPSQAMDGSSASTISAFRRHVTIHINLFFRMFCFLHFLVRLCLATSPFGV
jgi:hypothetical protein